MQEELRKLIEENRRVMEEIISYGSLPLGEESADGMMARVVSEEFRTLEDLRAYLCGIYTPEEAERLLTDGDIGGPQYIEKDGQLWYDLQWMIGGAPSPWKSWTAEPEELPADQDRADVTVHVIFDTGEPDPDEEEEELTGTYHLTAVRTDAGWRLEKMADTPDEWLVTYEDEETAEEAPEEEEAAGEELPEADEEA